MTHNRNDKLLEMEGIGKLFSGVRVLDSVDFNLDGGEVHILAGENGAGKTTLIKILAGVHTDYEGQIKLESKAVRFRSPHDASVYGISAIHQEMSMVNPMSVSDNIFLGRERTKTKVWMDYRTQSQTTKGLLAQLKLDVDLSRPVEDYPLSMRQMFEIAKALAYETKIIVMDEPTSALNDVEVARLFQIIKELKNKGKSIVYITHRLEEIYEIGDRITVLRDGKHVGTSLIDALPPNELIQWMVGRTIHQQFPERSPKFGKNRLCLKNIWVPDPTGAKPWAVEDVSLDVKEGEILGIAGLQGSGKSELLNGLFGTYGKIVQGEVRLEDHPIKIRSPKHSIESGMVLLTNNRKDTGIIPEMDIMQNITLASLRSFSKMGWMQTQSEEQAAKKHADELDIRAHSLAQDIDTLSGGNQQKVILARWLETQPKVLLLDEPTRGVDVSAKHDIYELMNSWTSQGISILLITSELPELLSISDRIIVMFRGQISAQFSSKDATQKNIIQAAMGEGVHSRQ
ncbi:MAG: sugar ABC transporter ATP-binding protein [Candidatus Aminicenantes bacterium]